MKKGSMCCNVQMALVVAGCIFSLGAIAHALRLIYHVSIVISGTEMPMQVSVASMLVNILLAIWMFKACMHRHKGA